MSAAYQEFLSRRAVAATPRGIENVPAPPDHLFRYQAECAAFGLRQGSWACWLCSLRAKRRFIGMELKASYFKQAAEYLKAEDSQASLFEEQPA